MSDELKRHLGWRFSWYQVPNNYVMIWIYGPLYMPILEVIARASQIIGMTALGYWSGFMSESRGLNWDRKSRYGVK